MPRLTRRHAAILLIVATLGPWTLAAAWLDHHGQRQVPAGSWDAIVVAGCRVDPGGVPSPALQRRTELGVELWRQGRAPVLAFTGGVGEHPPSEAQAASDLAAELGVPQDAMVLEQRSASTEENARFLAQDHGYEHILLVTDAYHVFRARQVFAHHFPAVDAAGSISPAWPRLRGAFREVLAVTLYRARGRIVLFEGGSVPLR